MHFPAKHAADAYDEIVRGDPAMEAIYHWNETHMTINVRGASGQSDGAHIMTGEQKPPVL